MKKTIDMMVQLLEKNNIPLPEGARKKEGGSMSDNEEIFHALVARYSRYSSFIIESAASKHMASMHDSFSSLHPYSGPSIPMSDDS